MIDFIKNNWFQVVFLLLVYPAYKGIIKSIENGFSQIPQNMHEKRMEEIKKENNLLLQDNEYRSTRELQVDNYYRSISGQKIEALFSRWMDMIANTEKICNLSQKELNNMIKELMMYGSNKTVYIGSLFQQYSYRYPSGSDDFNPFELLYLGASLVASMKKDFTGYEVAPEVLLTMKIKDIHSEENSEKFAIAKANAERIIKEGF